MKTDYIVRRRALLSISALFCTTLLLFGCQDIETPVGPELDSPVASETAGVTFAAKGKPGGDPLPATLSLAGGMSAPDPFDVHVKETKKILKFSNTTNDNFTKPAEILMAFPNPGTCEGIPATNGDPGPEEGSPLFDALRAQLSALVERTEDNVYPKVVIEINQADLLSGREDHHFLLVQYFDTNPDTMLEGKITFMLGGWPGPVLVTEGDEDAFTFTGSVVVGNDGVYISCPGVAPNNNEVVVTLVRNL